MEAFDSQLHNEPQDIAMKKRLMQEVLKELAVEGNRRGVTTEDMLAIKKYVSDQVTRVAHDTIDFLNARNLRSTTLCVTIVTEIMARAVRTEYGAALSASRREDFSTLMREFFVEYTPDILKRELIRFERDDLPKNMQLFNELVGKGKSNEDDEEIF